VRRFVVCLFLLFFAFGCVDRLFYDIAMSSKFGLSISGHITDNGGPHRVSVFRNFDVESRDSLKTGVSAKSVVITDADGNSANLSQVASGIYETKVNDIVGKVGGIYKVTVELEDGRVYESTPDTLPVGGVIDNAYYKYADRPVVDGYIYEYEIYANSKTNADLSKTFFMWSNKVTYKSTTKPELEYLVNPPCYRQLASPYYCNLVSPCTGLKNVGNNFLFVPEYVGPCECCTCWYDQYNRSIVLNDVYPSIDGVLSNIPVDKIEQTGWNMMYKMRVEISMNSLSKQGYRFWKALRDQREATTNIFQPITGKIPGNIIQTKGTTVPAEGIFYGTSLSQKVFYIVRGENPVSDIPTIDAKGIGYFPCQRLAPNSTTIMPSYWID